MATAQPNDQFLVNRDGVSYNVTQQNLMAQIQDTDLMLVNRDDVSYKITGAEVKDSFVDPLELTVSYSTMDPVEDEDITAIANATGGKGQYSYAYQWQRNDVDIADATQATYLVSAADVGFTLDCIVTVTDELGTSTTENNPPVTNPVKSGETINQPVLLTPPDGAGLSGDTAYNPMTSAITAVADFTLQGGYTTVTTGQNDYWDALAYGNGRFVALPNGNGFLSGLNSLISTDDGATWTTSTDSNINYGIGVTPAGLIFAYGYFWAVISSTPGTAYDIPDGKSAVVKSTDGVTWTQAAVLDNSDNVIWQAIASDGKGKLMVVGDNASYYNQNDPEIWSNIAITEDGGATWAYAIASPNINQLATWNSVAYGDGVWVVGGANSVDSLSQQINTMWSDNNGTTWNLPTGDYVTGTDLSNTQFIGYNTFYSRWTLAGLEGTGPTPTIQYSNDGKAWNAAQSGGANITQGYWYGGTSSGGKTILVSSSAVSGGQQIIYTENGTDFTYVTPSVSETTKWYGIQFGKTNFVVVGTQTNYAMTSLTGTDQEATGKELTLTDSIISNASTGKPISDTTITVSDAFTTDSTAYSNTDQNGIRGSVYGESTDSPAKIKLYPFTGTWATGMKAIDVNQLIEPDASPDADNLIMTCEPFSGTGDPVYASSRWQVSSTEDFSVLEVDATQGAVLEYQVPPGLLSDSTEYYARVLQESAEGTISDVNNGFSEANHFRTGSPAVVEGWNLLDSDSGFVNDQTYYSITYGGGKFVTVSNDGGARVAYSTDGLTWSYASAAEQNNWYGVTYGNNTFVAVAADNVSNPVMTSPDAVTWTAVAAPSDAQAVAFGPSANRFVAVTPSAIMYSNNDGSSWTKVTTTASLRAVSYGDESTPVFVAVGDNGAITYSLNSGLAWTLITVDSTNWHSVAFGNDKFVAVGKNSSSSNNNVIAYSSDGVNWTTAEPPDDGGDWKGVAYGNGKFVAVAGSGTNRVMNSEDGITWVMSSAAAQNDWKSIVYGDDKFVAVAQTGTNRAMWSYTGYQTPVAEEAFGLTYYYNERTQQMISADNIRARYGLDPQKLDLGKIGIRNLKGQPLFSISGFQKEADGDYTPLRDFLPELRAAAAAWAQTTAYIVGQLVVYENEVYTVTVAHTSSSSFDIANFSQLS